MCGLIFGARFDGKNAAGLVTEQYAKQKSRGTRGFGFVSVQGGQFKAYKRSDTEGGLKKAIRERCEMMLYHHRFPTSVENLPETAHPIKVDHPSHRYVYYVAHNGHISNHEERRKAHVALGYRYNTEVRTILETSGTKYDLGLEWNDSEALAIDLSRYLEGKQDALIATGSIAFLALKFTRSGEFIALYYGRGSNPLKVRRERRSILIASEAVGEDVPVNTLITWNGTTEKQSALTIGIIPPPVVTYSSYGGAGTYGYYLPHTQTIPPPLPKGDKEAPVTLIGRIEKLQERKKTLADEIAGAEVGGFLGYAARLRSELERIEDELDIAAYKAYDDV